MGQVRPVRDIGVEGLLALGGADFGRICGAGKRMTRAAVGADGIKEANHARRDPISGWLC
jgi:hypothetical protein